MITEANISKLPLPRNMHNISKPNDDILAGKYLDGKLIKRKTVNAISWVYESALIADVYCQELAFFL